MIGVDHIAGWMRRRPAVRRRFNPYVVGKLCHHAVDRMLDEGRTMVRVSDVEAAS